MLSAIMCYRRTCWLLLLLALLVVGSSSSSRIRVGEKHHQTSAEEQEIQGSGSGAGEIYDDNADTSDETIDLEAPTVILSEGETEVDTKDDDITLEGRENDLVEIIIQKPNGASGIGVKWGQLWHLYSYTCIIIVLIGLRQMQNL